MAKIAIMGFGTVGSGVLEVIRRSADSLARRAQEPVEVKYILDVRDFSDHPDHTLFVKSIDVILQDPEIRAVVETIGGATFAYTFVKACLQSGRSVCTSNKELVATHGAELIALAQKNGCAFLFEASVGGGMPLITPMSQCLATNSISRVEGIVNGTTNFMLTKMKNEGMSFADALKLAQKLGYAETKDPGDDVDGPDACRKIAILASMISGQHVYPANIPTAGIRDITAADMDTAARLGCAIKLIAWARRTDSGALAAGVEPMLVPHENQLSGVDDVYNAVLIRGDMLGDVLFYGKGAGKLPTASAVVADVIEALKNGASVHNSLFWQPGRQWEGKLEDSDQSEAVVRVSGLGVSALEAIYGPGRAVHEQDGQIAYQVQNTTQAALAAAKAQVEAQGGAVALQLRRLPE